MLQLVYMWIEDFRTLKNANLNFHSNFKFEFEPTKIEKINLPNGHEEESVKEGKLKIKKFNPDDNFIYKYFQNEEKDKKNKQFISLIVGKNGTGKTSVLDAIAGDYQYTYSDKKAIFLLYNAEKREFLVKNGEFLINGNNNNTIKSLSLEELSKIYNSKKELSIKILEEDRSYVDVYIAYASFENLKYDLGLSPILPYETTKEIIGHNNLTDKKEFLSLAVQINNALYNIAKSEKIDKGKSDFTSNIIFKRVLKWIEHEDTIYFLRNYSTLKDVFKDISDVKFPENLFIQYTPKDENFFEERLGLDSKLNGFSEEEKSILKKLTNFIFSIQNNESLDLFKRLKASFVLSLIEEDIIYGSMSFIKLWLKDLNEILESNQNEEKKLDNILNNLMEEINSYEEFRTEIENFFDILVILKDFNKSKFPLGFEKNLNELNKESLRQLEKTSGFIAENFVLVPSFLNFSFDPPLSSGHKNLFKVFSYIEELINPTVNKDDVRNNIILLLDEPESYFHPEWQRLFIYFLTKFLEERFSESEKNFHVIITTHSPFLLSDIPKENCVFLDLNEEYEVVPSKKDFNTLAQNIYYLLAEGFFMEKGIGEYINNRLKQFLSKINEGTLSPEEEKEFRYIIENIGDIVLRNKLLQIVENKNFYKDKLHI